MDSTAGSEAALGAAQALATAHACIVAVTGEADLVTDGSRVVAVRNGVEMLTLITATGCSVTALVAGFMAAAGQGRGLDAVAAALAVFGCVGGAGGNAWGVFLCHARQHVGRNRGQGGCAQGGILWAVACSALSYHSPCPGRPSHSPCAVHPSCILYMQAGR